MYQVGIFEIDNLIGLVTWDGTDMIIEAENPEGLQELFASLAENPDFPQSGEEFVRALPTRLKSYLHADELEEYVDDPNTYAFLSGADKSTSEDLLDGSSETA